MESLIIGVNMTLKFRKTIIASIAMLALGCLFMWHYNVSTTATAPASGPLVSVALNNANPNQASNILITAKKSDALTVGVLWRNYNSWDGDLGYRPILDTTTDKCQLSGLVWADENSNNNDHNIARINGPWHFYSGQPTTSRQVHRYGWPMSSHHPTNEDRLLEGKRTIHTAGQTEETVIVGLYGKYCLTFFDISDFNPPNLDTYHRAVSDARHLTDAQLAKIKAFYEYIDGQSRLSKNNENKYHTYTESWVKTATSEFYIVDFDSRTVTFQESNTPPVPTWHNPSNAGSTAHHIKVRASLDTSRLPNEGEDTNYYIDWGNNETLGSAVYVWSSATDTCSPTSAASNDLNKQGQRTWIDGNTGAVYALRLVDGCPDDFYTKPANPPQSNQ